MRNFKTGKNRENVTDLHLLVVDNFNFAEKLLKLNCGHLFLYFVKKDEKSDFRTKRNLNFPATKAAVLTSTDFKTKQVFPEKIPFLDFQTRYGKIYCYGKFNLYFKTKTKAGTYQK